MSTLSLISPYSTPTFYPTLFALLPDVDHQLHLLKCSLSWLFLLYMYSVPKSGKSSPRWNTSTHPPMPISDSFFLQTEPQSFFKPLVHFHHLLLTPTKITLWLSFSSPFSHLFSPSFPWCQTDLLKYKLDLIAHLCKNFTHGYSTKCKVFMVFKVSFWDLNNVSVFTHRHYGMHHYCAIRCILPCLYSLLMLIC